MASGFSIYYANLLLDKVTGVANFSPPSSMYVALFRAVDAATQLRNNNAGAANEVSGNGYARVEILGATGITFVSASSGQVTQSGDIIFPAATGSWGTIYATALMDDPLAGNVIVYDDWTTPEEIAAPDIPRIPSGNLIITL